MLVTHRFLCIFIGLVVLMKTYFVFMADCLS